MSRLDRVVGFDLIKVFIFSLSNFQHFLFFLKCNRDVMYTVPQTFLSQHHFILLSYTLLKCPVIAFYNIYINLDIHPHSSCSSQSSLLYIQKSVDSQIFIYSMDAWCHLLPLIWVELSMFGNIKLSTWHIFLISNSYSKYHMFI